MSSYRLITIQETNEGVWLAQDPLVPYARIEANNAIEAATNAVEVANAWYIIEEKGNIDKESEVRVWGLTNSRAVNGMATFSIECLISHLTKEFPLESERLSIKEALAWVHVATILNPGETVTIGSWTIKSKEKPMKRNEFTGNFDKWIIKEEEETAKTEIASIKNKKKKEEI